MSSRQVNCARCGRRLNADAPRVYSAWTHSYYCAAVNRCAKRAKRKAKR